MKRSLLPNTKTRPKSTLPYPYKDKIRRKDLILQKTTCRLLTTMMASIRITQTKKSFSSRFWVSVFLVTRCGIVVFGSCFVRELKMMMVRPVSVEVEKCLIFGCLTFWTFFRFFFLFIFIADIYRFTMYTVDIVVVIIAIYSLWKRFCFNTIRFFSYRTFH